MRCPGYYYRVYTRVLLPGMTTGYLRRYLSRYRPIVLPTWHIAKCAELAKGTVLVNSENLVVSDISPVGV